jgi:hypothetical protein
MKNQKVGVFMISGGKSSSAATLVLEKEQDYELSPRLLELREKIKSQEYLENAILRIATVISGRLLEDNEELKFRD